MHKAVLLDLDTRPNCCKLSFDCSNARNEFDRDVVADAVLELIPELLPWARTSLFTSTTHVHNASDGYQTKLVKDQRGDQGDAITALVFPLT